MAAWRRQITFMPIEQSWARAFFKASRLRFHAPGGSSSRLRFCALFLALNFTLLRSRFRAPEFLDFSRSFFALLDFSRSFSRSSIFCALFSRSSIFSARNFVLVRLFTARTGQPGQDTQNRTNRTGQPEQVSENRTVRTGQQERDRQNKTALTGEPG